MSILQSIHHLPLRFIFPNLPAFPVQLEEIPGTLTRLAIRDEQTMQAKQGLTGTYTIGGVTDVGYAFLFGGAAAATPATVARTDLARLLEDEPARVLTALFSRPFREDANPFALSAAPAAPSPVSLDDPEQFSISWTTLPNVYEAGLPLLPAWASSLSDADAATEQFWPTMARYGLAYNLLVLEKATPAKAGACATGSGRPGRATSTPRSRRGTSTSST